MGPPVDQNGSDSDAGRADGGDRSAEEPPSIAGLFGTLSRAVRSRPPGELLIVVLPLPVLLVIVAVLPESGGWALSLSATGILESRWTLWTAFASSFVHTEAGHLLDNVVNYWLVLAVAYPLSIVAGWRRRLLYAAVTYVVLVPFVSAWATLLAFGGALDAPAAGFSDVNSAFLGYLVVVWFAALSTEAAHGGRPVPEDRSATPSTPASSVPPRPRTTISGIDVRWSFAVVFGSLAVVFLSPSGAGYFPPSPTIALPFVVVAFGTAAYLFVRVGRPRIAGLDLPPSRELLYVTGASVGVAGVIGSLVIVPLGSNVFAHLAGYAVGVSVALVWVIGDASRTDR